ncbi:hypothetical protein BP5796_02025 [Coleophoma crateriformis]|uniref:Uncharacterized protein n=1 Tax=Coleophoma crateriformis TaxID=565419 RepID=A0A3D8T2H3_9HELO|nr:hypothetical protein BP5796_02025 [Coleophoma crateriformis]
MDNNEVAKDLSSQSLPNQASTTDNAARDTQQKALLGVSAGLTTYRAVKGAHKIGTHIHRFAGALDPTLDLGDADDITDSDDSMSGSDNDSYDDEQSDSDSIRSQHSDDEEIQESSAQNHGSGGGLGKDTPLNVGNFSAAGLPRSLPTTRPAKIAELPITRSTKSITEPAAVRGEDLSKSTLIAAPTDAPDKPTNSSVLAVKDSDAGNSLVASAKLTQATTTTNKAAESILPGPQPANSSQEKDLTKTSAEEIQYEIVRVRKPDGTIVKVRRPIKATTEAKKQGLQIGKGEPVAAKTNHEQVASEKESTPIVKAKALESTTTPSSPKGQPAFAVTEIEKQHDGSSEILRNPQTKAEILHRRTSKITQIIVWSIMISLPLLFIVLAILTASATGKPEASSLGQGITRANKVAVSLWPIAFAAIAAQALRMYASWKVESGLQLMTLEQLINSHSVASAIKQPFLLQRVNWTSIALLCLWSLSPLAGQAFVRMSFVGNSGAVHNTTLNYLDNTITETTKFAGGSSTATFLANIDALFGSLILAPSSNQQAPMDSWGNVKIPRFEELTQPKDGWLQVPSSPSYSSLLGIPISGLTDDGGNSSFAVISTYYSFDCPPLTNATLDSLNDTVRSAGGGLLESTSGTLHMAVLPPTENTTTQILYATQNLDESADGISEHDYTICTFAQVYVESHVLCAGKDCHADKMRLSTLPDSDPRLYQILTNMVIAFTHSGESSHSTAYSPLQWFLNNTARAGSNDFESFPDVRNVPTTDFNTRLSILLNTYWLAGIAPYDFTGVLRNKTDDADLLTAVAIQTSTAQVYHTNWGWLVLLLATSVFLLLGGVVGAICDSRTVGPDIFGFASSLAHKNKYMRVPSGTGDSTIGGPQRARMLGDVRVMLQDVKPAHPVGKIALGTVENGGAKLQLGRKYK